MITFARWIAAAVLLHGFSGASLAQVGGFGGFGQASGMMLNVGGPNTQAAGEIGIRPWAMVSGNYGQSRTLQAGGAPSKETGYGALAAYGVAGGRSWYRTSLGLSLGGMYRPKLGKFSRSVSSHVLTLGVSHLTGPRTRVSVAATAGYSNGGMGFGGGALNSGLAVPFGIGNILQMGSVDFGNPNENAFVDEEVFDVGTLFGGVTGSVVHQLSQRWNVGAGGGAFTARRRYQALAQSEGRSANALALYNIDRTSGIGVQYAQTWFSFRNLFGGNRAQMLSVFYRKSLSQRVVASLAAGAFQLRTTFIGQVAVDPAFQDLLGGFQSFEVREGTRRGLMATATIARNFRNGFAGASYFRGLTPGNGVLLASRRDRATLNASIGLPGRFGLGGLISYGEMNSIQQQGLRSRNMTAAGGVNRHLGAGFGFAVSGGYRHLKFNNAPSASWTFAMAGITWTPADAVLVF